MKNRWVFMVVFIMFLFFVPILSEAKSNNNDSKITLTETDDEGTNYYKYGSGTFESNLSDGATEEVAYIKWDEKLTVSLLQDGKQISYNSDDIIFENGNYVAIIYDLESGDLASMKFTIKNSLNFTNNTSQSQAAASNENEADILDSIGDLSNINDLGDLGISLSSNGAFSMENLEALQELYTEADNKESYRISINGKYDQETGHFTYGAAGKDIYITDVPNNAITNDSVYVKSADNAYIFVYRNGEILFANNNNTYTEPGYYDVFSFVYNVDQDLIPEDERVEGTNSYETHFVFRIIGDEINDIGVVPAPEGFKIDKITYNGALIEPSNRDYFFLEDDGRYNFEFVSDDSKITYEVGFLLDTVAPFIHFNQEIRDKRADAPISYVASEPEAEVVVTAGSVSVNLAPEEEYYYTGWYHFKISDKAGNARYYAVYVKEQYKFFSTGMIILLITIIVLFTAYVLIIRRGEYRVNDKSIEADEEQQEQE